MATKGLNRHFLAGFDPFDECSKGLADIFANERETNVNHSVEDAKPTAAPSNWSNVPAGNQRYFTHMNKDISQQYSLFGDTSQGISVVDVLL